MNKLGRGSGRTTKQILNAPLNSVFLCTNYQSMQYTKRLSYSNNRMDLKIIPCSYFSREQILGLNVFVVLDHSIKVGIDLSYKNYDYIVIHNHKIQSLNNLSTS